MTAFGITNAPPFGTLTEERSLLIREVLSAAAAASFANCLNEEMMCTIIDATAAAINLFNIAQFLIEAYNLADYGPRPIISSRIRQAIKDRCRHPGPAIKWKISGLNREQIESLLHFIMEHKDNGLSLAFNAPLIHAIRKQHIVNDGILLMAMGLCLRRADKEIMPIPIPMMPMPMLADLGGYGIKSIIASMGDGKMPTDSAAGALLSFLFESDDED